MACSNLCSLTIKNINTDVKVSFCSAQLLIEENGDKVSMPAH